MNLHSLADADEDAGDDEATAAGADGEVAATAGADVGVTDAVATQYVDEGGGARRSNRAPSVLRAQSCACRAINADSDATPATACQSTLPSRDTVSPDDARCFTRVNNMTTVATRALSNASVVAIP